MRKIQRLWVGLGVLSLIWLGGGCVHQKELENAHIEALANPNNGPAVRVLKVTDLRKFEADPQNIQTPTVVNSDEIANRAVTLRAIGKGENAGYTFYYTYPEGRTVETEVQTVVENALRTKGYFVVANDSPSAASAIPVTVEIRKSWFWFVTGVWTMTLQYDVVVDVTSPIVLNGGTESAAGHFDITSPFMVDRVCENCICDGLDDLRDKLLPKLKKPG